MTKRTQSLLRWKCDRCGDPIISGTGYIAIDLHETATAEALTAEWRARHREGTTTLAALSTLPDQALWVVAHDTCAPLPDGPYYCIDIERAETAAHLLSWTAHLMGKPWISATNWDDLIREMAGVDA